MIHQSTTRRHLPRAPAAARSCRAAPQAAGDRSGIGYRPYDAPEYAASKAGVVRLTAALGGLKDKLGVRVNCICPGWVETKAVQRALATMTPEEIEQQPFPPPPVLIKSEEIADAVVMFVQDSDLAGRVMVWPDGEPWRLVPVDARY